jgi:creatinine amidohydrolase
MFWEELTGDQFPQAVAAAQGVCLVPLSCIERHGHHLPLGTDRITGHEVCRRAALLEPVVVFPDVIFTQILEARHCPGTISVNPDLMLSLLEEVCREVARNGFHKIAMYSSHGGNTELLAYFNRIRLAARHDYTLYVVEPRLSPEDRAACDAMWDTVDHHAGEHETSSILAIRPDLVRREAIPDWNEGAPLGRLQVLSDAGIRTPNWWYADHPTHYGGDAHPATAAKGEHALDATARALASAIRIVKQDQVAKLLLDEYYGQMQHHAAG